MVIVPKLQANNHVDIQFTSIFYRKSVRALPIERERMAIADFRRPCIHVLLVIIRGDILALERGARTKFMEIRPAESADLESASQLWFERINLLQQTDWDIRLPHDAKEAWRVIARSWIADETVHFLVSEKSEQLIGLIAVGVVDGMPGLHPKRKGVVWNGCRPA